MYILYLKKYGQLGLGDLNVRYSPKFNSRLSNITKISSGGFHSLALNISGNVFSFGCNEVHLFLNKVWTTWNW
jgi:alpha-tubulin suppressor-like RCC1 family protein